MPRSQSSFEDLPGVSGDGNQILRNIFVGFGLCKNGVWLPRIVLNDHVFTSLFDLETRLMSWAQSQQSARNNGFEVWHAKYLAGCCFLVGSEISVYRKTSSVQTTTRTTRCAVSMINEVVKDVYGMWGVAAFAILPALAMRKYMLAAVARHCEQKRSLTIPEVSRNLAQHFCNPGPPEYCFNPVRLFSKLTGEEESRIASWLGLPDVPDMPDCSWQDLGLGSIQKFVDNVATESAYSLNQGIASSRHHGLPSPPPFDDTYFRALPSTSAPQSFTSTSHSFEPPLRHMQPVGTTQSEFLRPEVGFPSQMISRTDTLSHWPTPPQRYTQVKQERRGFKWDEPNAKRQKLALRHTQSQTQVGSFQSLNDGHQEPLFASESSAMNARTRHSSLGHQSTFGYMADDYVSNGYVALALDRPFDAFSQIEEIQNPQHFNHF